LGIFAFLACWGQAALVVHARPQDLITAAHGMADFLSRAFPPGFSNLGDHPLAGVLGSRYMPGPACRIP
jgi:hypothetical protein